MDELERVLLVGRLRLAGRRRFVTITVIAAAPGQAEAFCWQIRYAVSKRDHRQPLGDLDVLQNVGRRIEAGHVVRVVIAIHKRLR